MDEGRWPRKVKAANVDGQQGRGRPRFDFLNRVKRSLVLREVILQEESTQLAREKRM